MTNIIGQSIGRYHILEQLGEGGMATVYKAFDTRLERDVAIKVIRRSAFPPEQLERILKRFEREAKALARLSHPNILKVLDYGEHEGAPYLVLEYLPGGTLKQRMGQLTTGWQDALTLMLPIVDALAYAHEHKIIHRDIKPSNILLTEKGQPLLTDFGIAKILDIEDGQTLTGAGVGVGTPEYMAPEQGMGKEVDARADVYSIGIVLYELLTGRKPYTADTPMAVVFKHITDPLPRPRQFTPGLPDGVEKLLLKALAKQPEDRFENMSEFTKGIRVCLANPPGNVSKQTLGSRNTISEHEEQTTDQFLISANTVVSKKPARRIGWLIAISLAVVGVIMGGWLFWPKPTGGPMLTQTTTPFLSISATLQDTPMPSKTPDEDSSILFYEDFEDGKTQQITYSEKEWQIVTDETGNNVYDVDNSKGSDYPRIHLGSNSWRDYETTFHARIISGSQIIIYFRQNELTYDSYVIDIRLDNIALNYNPNGSGWKPITSRQHSLKRNEWYLISIQAKGSEIKVMVNDNTVIFTDDQKYMYGFVDIQAGPYTHAQFDDIKVISVEK